jgi:hypothetical protein
MTFIVSTREAALLSALEEQMASKPRPTRRSPAPRQEAASETEALPARPKSLVFVSHDSRDADLAEAFSTMLTSVSAGTLKSFRSSDKKGTSGIGFGEEWYTAIMSRLSEATDVVALLTPQSIDRPWILYEAGVAKGKLDTTVLGIALGVPLEKVSTGPFGQFQNCGDDEDSLTGLVMQLLSRNPDASPLESAVRMQVKLFRDKLSTLVGQENDPPTEDDDDQSAARLFEEVKAMVRELPDRVESRIRSATKRRPFDRGQMPPMMIAEELLFKHRVGDLGDQSSRWLIYISLFKEDLPWIYESGMEIYRAMQARPRSNLDKAIRNFRNIVLLTLELPVVREMTMVDKEIFLMMRHAPRFMDRFLASISPSATDEV